MIVGIGIDVADIARFEQAMARTPGMAERLFSEAERSGSDGAVRSGASLAARFAAKEAVAKALGAPGGLRWLDVEVRAEESGRPVLVVRGSVAARGVELGVRGWHLSLSHDGGVATAMVVVEG